MRYPVEEFEGAKVLYMKEGEFRGTARGKLRVVAREDLWDTLVAAHHELSHGSRDRMYDYFLSHHYHVLRAVIVLFVRNCPTCQATKGKNSTVGYATGKPTDNILTAVTSLINSIQLQHYSTHKNITLVASLHMMETLRANNPTQLYHFLSHSLSHSLSSLRVLQTERGMGRDEDTECLMRVCTLRQLSKCPRMMSLYYWLNEAEGKVRDRLGIRNVVIKNGWIPYNSIS